MDKRTLNIPAADGKWGSYISKYPPDSGVVGNSAFTAGTRNLITSASGQAEKRQGGILWNPESLLSGPALDQFEGVFSSGQRLFIVNDAGTLKASTGNGVFTNLVGGTGFANPANFEFVTYRNRIYGSNGVDAPIVIDVAGSYGGVSYSAVPAKVRPMGAQAPATGPTAGTPSSGGAIPAGAHTYKITYLYYNGEEESNGSLPSGVQTASSPNFTIALSNIPVGGYGVTGRNIYRDNNDGNYLLLDAILDNTTTTYSDHLLVGSTPTPIPQLNFAPPLFRYGILYLDRIFVIDIAGKNILWSLAGSPDVFYPQNAISGPADDIMTGFGILNGLPYVFGQHTVGTILGTTDSSFYYNSLSTEVGCVDNRTIQTRLIVSVPTLMWLAALPNRGIYYTNGSIIQHLSDNIQDLAFNLAQISYLSRLNSQVSQADFEAGTSSEGIDLASNPGTIQTINPKALYSRSSDWQSGTLSNLAVIGDELRVPTAFSPAITAGGLGGSAMLDYVGNVTLPTQLSYPGENIAHYLPVYLPGLGQKVAMPILPGFNGQLTTFALQYFSGDSIGQIAVGSLSYAFKIWNDGGDQPGSELYSQAIPNPSTWDGSVILTTPFTMTAGTKYWLGVALTNFAFMEINAGWSTMGYQGPLYSSAHEAGKYWNGSIWQVVTNNPYGPTPVCPAFSTSYAPAPVPSSGVWTSPIYDCASTTIPAHTMSLSLTASYPSGTSAGVVVQGSPDKSVWTTTDTLSSPAGAVALTGGAYRYWQFIYNLASTTNTVAPALSAGVLSFGTTGIWTSPPVALTSDVTALNTLAQSVMVPSGTSAAIAIATSASSGSGYSSFGPLGSATPRAWAKIQVTLTTDAANVTSAMLSAVELGWTLVTSFISSAVDTGQTPNGWGIFEFAGQSAPGAVASYFRTAATSGALAGAAFAPIINGGFATNAVNEFFQYKLVLTATADQIPQVDTITTNWLLSSGTNVRPASLFFNKSYYLSVATQGATSNNLLIEFDYQDNWRIHDGVRIGAMATYFNDIFYCDALNGNVYNGFKSATDNGNPIAMRLRTKCFDLGDNLRLKTARSVKITGVNTGTLLTVSYSVDKGSTWHKMLNSSGSLDYQTTADGSAFIEYFVPVFDGSVPVSGRTIMYEVASADKFPCAILQITPVVYVHKGKAVREAMAA